MTNKSIVYHRTNFFSVDYFLQISCWIDIEYYNREIIFLAHASSRKVHHLQTAFQHFIISDIIEFCSSRIFFRIGGVYPVYTGAFQHYVGFYFDAAQRRTGIGCKKRIACSGRHAHFITGLYRISGGK